MGKLVGYFSLLSLLTVSSMGAIAFYGSRVVITRLVFDRLRATAILKQDALNLWVENQRDATIALAQLPEIRDRASVLLEQDSNSPDYIAAYIQIKRSLSSVIASRPELQEVFILSDVGGKVILSTQQQHENEYRVKDKYFLEGRNDTFVQNVYPSSFTGRPTMTLSTPLRDRQGQRIGVLAAHLNLERMNRIVLERTGLGMSGETYLVDRYNSFVFAERFGSDEFPRGVNSEGIDRALQGNDGGGLYLNYRRIPVIGYYLWVEDRELALVVEMQQAEAFVPARSLAWGILVVGAASTLLLTGGVYLLARRIAKPILAIADTAAKVADGDLSPRAPVMTEDEVGVLARAFNQMTNQLRELYQGLQQKVDQLQQAELTILESLNELRAEQEKSDRLLLNIFPATIATQLKEESRILAEHFDSATVLFADIVGFTQLATQMSPLELVNLLNEIFSSFDQLTEKHGLEKIKTIGDAYMVVGGLPMPRADHAEAIAKMALEMNAKISQFSTKSGEAFQLRIGISSGPVVAGTIGLRKFIYDLWGDTVNIASRMESQGIPGVIQVSEATYELLQSQFVFERRGIMEIKGKGQMVTYLLLGRKNFIGSS